MARDTTREVHSKFINHFEPTGATAGRIQNDGFLHQSALGLGVSMVAGKDGGATGSFDAVAEIAFATINTSDIFSVSKSIHFHARLRLSDIGDAAALDFDWGLGTLLTANSIGSIDHADMVNLACFHMDGTSANILCQSDNNVTDVAPVDSTIDNATDTFKEFDIIVRATGAVEFYIDGAQVLTSTTFAVDATVALCAFIHMEKTSDDTTAAYIVDEFWVRGAAA